MVFMAPLLAGLLLGFLPSGSFFEPGGNGWAHPVRIARCWFQLIILHLLFGQRLCVGQFAPCHQPAVCHRTPPVIIVVDDGKRLVIRRLRVSSYVHGPLGGIIAVNALRSQLGMPDCRMVMLRRSHTLIVCGSVVDEDVKNDIAVAGRLGIAATTLEGVLAVKGHGTPGHAGH